MRALILLLATATAMPVVAQQQSDWPSWRGTAAEGSTATGRYPTQWTAEQAAWSMDLPGKGSSTPIVWRDRIYLTTPAEGEDAVLAVHRSGRQSWLTKLGPMSAARHRSLGSSCNASPVTDGSGVYARFRSGRVAALELDGRVRWQVNLEERFGPERLFWDAGSSPVLSDRCVIVTRLHQGDSWVAGFDKKSGEQRWLVKRNFQTPPENDNGYTTPVFFNYKGRKAFLVWAADHLTAHSSEDGALLWSCGGFNPTGQGFWPAIASPVVSGNIAIVPVGRDDRPGQSRIHAVRVDGSGYVTATHRAWQRDDLGVFCSTPVVYQDRVYLLRHRGGVVCLDPATGKTIWENAFPRTSASYYSSPLFAGGILYAAREDGVVFAARVQDGFELLSENPMGDRMVASPVPAGDILLLRGERRLFAIAAGRTDAQ